MRIAAVGRQKNVAIGIFAGALLKTRGQIRMQRSIYASADYQEISVRRG
jgi:hypothetical protein